MKFFALLAALLSVAVIQARPLGGGSYARQRGAEALLEEVLEEDASLS
jgi:hypothetical protein